MGNKSNSTYYSNERNELSSVLFPVRALCMSFIKYDTGTFNIIVPFDDLQDGISKEDVYAWGEIGNKLIFPAVITEGFSTFDSSVNLMSKCFKNEVIIPKEQEANHFNKSSKNFSKAVVCSVTGMSTVHKANVFTISARLSEKVKNCPHGYYTGSIYNMDARDFVFEATGKCVNEYCIKQYNKNVNDKISSAGESNCFIISIDLNNIKNNYHKLLILTFYRYLWSSYYTRIVQDTFKVIGTGIDPWSALLIVHASKRDVHYDPYYAFTDKELRSYVKWEDIIKKLEYCNINNSFKNDLQRIHIPSFTIDGFNDYGTILKSLKQSKSFKINDVLCCNNKNVLGLTYNKKYKVSGISDKKIRVVNDNYCNLWYSKFRFKL